MGLKEFIVKRLYPLLFISVLIYWSCEDEQTEAESDTTPPLLFVTSHESGQSISEVITITAVSEDDRGVSRLEFYLNNILEVTDTTLPYEFQINTTQYDNDQLLVIKVESYDYTQNMARVVINLVVDNSVAVPLGGNITSVTYNLDSMTVEWLASTDGDFRDYKVLHSSINVGARDTVGTYTDISITSHTITEFDPTQDNWFWVQVTDTLGLSSIGTGMTNSLDSEPTPVNITSVTYDLESMTIIWEEYVPNMGRINQMNQNTRSTVTNDFVSYELLQSDSEDGTYTSVVVITDQSITSHSITEYDPTQENWFKVKVTDYWNLTSTGTGMTNEIDSPPSQIDISSVTYDLTEMVVTWNQSNDNDFVSYELLYSETQNGEQISITSITDVNTTLYTIFDFDPSQERWYWIKVTDFWNLSTTSNGYMVLDDPPTTPVLYPVEYNGDSFVIGWSQNNDDDFVSYKLYESLYEDMSNQTEVFTSEDNTNTSYTVTGVSESEIRYYQVAVTDTYGFRSLSNIKTGNSFNMFVKTFGYDDILDDHGIFVQQTIDGGYIILGTSGYIYTGSDDTWLIKTDLQGNEEWSQTFDGIGHYVEQTTDGGYIIGGQKYTDCCELQGWLIKTDSEGNQQWDYSAGSGINDDYFKSVQQTEDEGYIITGTSGQTGTGYYYTWLIKMNYQGQIEWSNVFPANGHARGEDVKELDDGGYIIVGNVAGYINEPGSMNLIKTDSQGNEEWIRNDYGQGSEWEVSTSVQQVEDGGYIISGLLVPYGTTFDSNIMWLYADAFLLKTDSEGNQIWFRNLGGNDTQCVQQTNDGGYIIVGTIVTDGYNPDVWLIKTNQAGNILWDRIFHGSLDEYGTDYGRSVQQTIDGGYIITGSTKTSNYYGTSDIWLIKTDPYGNTADYSD